MKTPTSFNSFKIKFAVASYITTAITMQLATLMLSIVITHS